MRPRIGHAMIALGAVLAAGIAGATARASDGPSIVVPGRPDVPVIINGIDAGGAVAVRDWGLFRPGVPVEIEPGPYLITPLRPVNGYFPATGRRPRYGRQEIEPGPNRVLPPPAPAYHRSWSSAPSGVTESAAEPAPPVAVMVEAARQSRQTRQRRQIHRSPHRHGMHR